MNITRVEPLLLSVPAPRRRVPLNSPRPAAATDVLAVRLHTDTDHVGLGFAPVPAAGLALRSLIETELAPLVTGEDPVGHENLFAKATAAGAKSMMPLADMFWGDRFGMVVDASGFPWGIATHKEDLTPEQMNERMKQEAPAKPAA